ncbi:MAG: protein kinase [Kofleriaceae bacterium]
MGALLGRGGMAEVFDGRSLGSHGFEKRVAIKRILPELAGDQTFTARLVVEAKLAVALQHANIVQALDLVRDGRDVFLVMEFINGPTLRKLLQERYLVGAGPLPLGLAAFVLHEAAAGLDYAHTQPGGAVIHADISPSNLLISRAGEVKLADFGIARREGIARAAEGKWGYMAPEQERGEPLSPRADLYALGVVVYELLTGVHPFGPRAPHSPQVVEPVIAPVALRPDLPLALSDLCMELLAPDIASRPASAKEVMERLAELRYHERWREGRSELAATVASFVPDPDAAPAPPVLPVRQRTEMTSHPAVVDVTRGPLTLVTRSLLIERAGSPSDVEHRSSSWSLAATAAMPASLPPDRSLGTNPGPELPPAEDPMSSALDGSVGGTFAAHATPNTWPVRDGNWALFSMKTWTVLGLAAVAGVLWGLRGGSSSTLSAPPAVAELGAAAEPTERLSAPLGSALAAPEPAGSLRADEAAPAAGGAPVAAEPLPGGIEPGGVEPAPGGAEPAPGGAEPAPGGAELAPGGAELAPGGVAPPREPTAAADVAPPPPEPPASPSPRRPSRPTPRPRPEARAEAGEGTLRIYAEPWAYVHVGDVRAETPARIKLRPGRHVVRMENPELRLSRTQTVRVRSNEITTLKVRWNE